MSLWDDNGSSEVFSSEILLIFLEKIVKIFTAT